MSDTKSRVYGLAFVLDVLTGILTGSRFGANADGHLYPEGGVGHLLIVLQPDLFIPREQFLDSVEGLIQEVKSVPLADGSDEIHIPGDIEYAVIARREREGIPISAELFEQLLKLGRELKVDSSDVLMNGGGHANV